MVIDLITRTQEQLANRLNKEMFVLALTYNGYSLEQIGNIMGIGAERVRQIKRKALVRIKKTWREYCDGKTL